MPCPPSSAPPLEGTTVIALEQAVSAPFATRQLADLGARVIKIERPGSGDFARAYDATVGGLSSYFVWLNRGKQSVTLDLKHPEAKIVLERLLTRADVFAHNLAPGAVNRLGFATDTLRRRYPALIVCAISGYGSTGPYRNRKAYDLLVQSEAGLLAVTGTPEVPSKAGISIADIAAGMYAYAGILTALLRRMGTGEGASLEVSLLEALGEWMSQPVYYTLYGGTPLPRTGARHASVAPYGPVVAQDGAAVFLSVQNDREWRRFCTDLLGQPALADDPRFLTNAARVRHRAELEAIIARVFAQWSADEVVTRLEAARIAYARMNTVEEFAAHAQLAARDRWREVTTPTGSIRALRPPVTIDGVETAVAGAVPAVGEHTNAILDELGFDQATIAKWRERGTI